jgi:putative sensor protein
VGAPPPKSDDLGMDTTLTPEPAWRSVLRPLITARGWTTLTHNLLGLVLGTAYFTWLVTGLATGLGLAITLLGIPILTLVFATVRPLLALERAMANAMLGAEIPDSALAPAGEGLWGRFKAYWTDSATWRGIAYLLARFPVGMFTFTVAVTAFSTALALIATPIVAIWQPLDVGIWHIDLWYQGLAAVPVGLGLLLASAWISEGLGAMSRALAHWGAR